MHASKRRSPLPRLALLALLVLKTSWLPAQPMPEDGTPIVEVVIEGLEEVEEDRIRRVMELREGGFFRAEALRRDIDAIAGIGLFNPTAIEIRSEEAEGGIRLTVSLQENPVVERLSIIGNVKYSEKEILSELDFAEGDILPLGAKESTRRNLRSFYSTGGYKSARVNVAVEPGTEPGKVAVQITIDEGERIKIKDLLFEGNESLSGTSLRLVCTNSGSWLFFNNYYDESAFEEDLRAVEQKYRDKGYLDAKARRGEFIYNRDEAWVSPVIVIEEGPRYRISSIAVTGNTVFKDEEVAEPFQHLVGDIYNGQDFRDALQELRRLYGDEGYVNLQFDGRTDKNPEAATVDISMELEENDVVYVGQINIQKREYDYDLELSAFEKFVDWMAPGVKEETIRREIKLEPGKKYRTADEVRTRDRLRRLGFFETVEVRRVPTDEPNVNDVVVEVEQDPSAGYVGLTVGVGEVSGAAVGIQYVNPDLFGEARVLRADAILGSDVSSFSLSYLDRYFKDTENSMEFRGYRNFAAYKGYDERAYGGSVEAGHPFSEYLTGFFRLRYEDIRLARDDDDLRESMRSYETIAARAMLVRDYRNSRRWTSRGYMASDALEGGYSKGALLQLTHRFEWYRALSDDEDWVYMYGHRVGLSPFDADDYGLSERFFIGGTSTLRGFEVRGVGPKDPGAKKVAIGGSTMLLQRHELRRRFSRAISGRLFVDLGMLDDEAFDLDPVRMGTGAGVTLSLGAVSLDLDLAAAALKSDRDRTRVLHFRLRSNF